MSKAEIGPRSPVNDTVTIRRRQNLYILKIHEFFHFVVRLLFLPHTSYSVGPMARIAAVQVQPDLTGEARGPDCLEKVFACNDFARNSCC